MDEVTEGSSAPSLSDVRKFQCCQIQLPTSTASMHMLLNDLSGANFNVANYHEHESSLLESFSKHNLQKECLDSCSRQRQSHGLAQLLCQEISDVSFNLTQNALQGGTLERPKLEQLQSFDYRGSERPPYQDTIHDDVHESAFVLPAGCGTLSSSRFVSGGFNSNSSYLSAATQHFAKGPLIYEVHNRPSDRSLHQSEQAHVQHIRSGSQKLHEAFNCVQPHGASALVAGPVKPRTRARRGQATDPHSIAERKRREKITNAMKELQELIPTLSKADRIAFVEDVIQYVKFLQIQTKVFIMSSLSNRGSIHAAETAKQEQEGPDVLALDLHESNLASIEEDVARLLKVDVGDALRLLHSKGLCLMPLSLAAVMPNHDTKQPTGFADLTT